MSIILKMTLAAACLAIPVAASAGPILSGFNTNTLAANDDGATPATNLGFTANFFGNNYTSTFVSNNGYLTFGTPQTNYTPTGLGSGYTGVPIIAAFFADVDTRGAGSGLLTYGTGAFQGHNAFGATWTDVGYFSQHADKKNSFQIILTDRSDTGAGNFDIFLNYGQIQWESGDASGGANGLGGTSAAVGYNAGTGNAAGTYYELAGSRTPGAFLDTGSAPLVRDNLSFQVRNGAVIAAVPEPATWAMMLVGFGMMGAAIRYRRRSTTTVYA